jgi:hypothetical protein
VKQISTLTINQLGLRHPLRDYQRRLIIGGMPTSVLVSGEEVAGQFECGRMSLLVTSCDYFNSVSYWFYLLDASGKVIDMVSTPDYFGFLEWRESGTSTELLFGFFGTNDVWRLSIHEYGQWSLTKAHLSRRVNRFFLSKRYLSLNCAKGAPWAFQQEEKLQR